MSELSETDDFKANYQTEVRIYEGFIAKPEHLYKNSKNKGPLKGLNRGGVEEGRATAARCLEAEGRGAHRIRYGGGSRR